MSILHISYTSFKPIPDVDEYVQNKIPEVPFGTQRISWGKLLSTDYEGIPSPH